MVEHSLTPERNIAEYVHTIDITKEHNEPKKQTNSGFDTQRKGEAHCCVIQPAIVKCFLYPEDDSIKLNSMLNLIL